MNQISPAASFIAAEVLGEAPTEHRMRFVDSGTFQCKYITSRPDENAVCCGAPTDGKSWCSYHRSVVFTQYTPTRVR